MHGFMVETSELAAFDRCKEFNRQLKEIIYNAISNQESQKLYGVRVYQRSFYSLDILAFNTISISYDALVVYR